MTADLMIQRLNPMRKVKRNRCKFEKYIDYRETVVADDINDIRVLTFE